MKNIPLMKVHVPPQEELMPELQKILYSGFISEGQAVKDFEEKFQNLFQIMYRPLSVNSGTAALELAYRCAGVKDRIVLTSPMSCFANVCAILNEGGKIVWCDVDPNTGNINVKDVAKKIEQYAGSRLGAVSCVDLGGYPAELGKLGALCFDWNLSLIEDAAQALGAKWNNRWIGTAITDFHYVAYSFQAIKHLTTIDGGMLVVNDCWGTDTYERAKKLKWFGINREAAKEETRWCYDIDEHGFKFHMNNVNATVGNIQLNHVMSIIDKHKENGRFLDANLKNISGLKQMNIPVEAEPSYWIYPVRVEGREDFAKMMKSKGIATNIAHVRNDSYSVCKDARIVLNHTEELPGLDEYEKEYIFIPCGWWVSEEDRQYIVDAIKDGW